MPAYRLLEWQQPARLVEVEVPEPGVGEVLVRVAGVGLCHSDILFLDAPPGAFPYPVPFTLGHEIGGWVEATGPGVTGVPAGQAVLVASRPRCGTCSYCRHGYDNYCESGVTGLGYGRDGGLAEFVVTPVANLITLANLDPCEAAPLTDAGKTSYHAVKRVLPKLVPGSTAVVIGVGGLGGYALQYLTRLSSTRVIAIDRARHRTEAARRLGVKDVVTVDGGPDESSTLRAAVMDLTGGRGAEAIFDFVGSDATIAAALSLSRPLGTVAIVGAGGGEAHVSWSSVARECEVWIPQGGTQQDLHEVVALAEQGLVRSENEIFPLAQVEVAYARLRAGDLTGRAVVRPGPDAGVTALGGPTASDRSEY